jgi:hypothetical protein
MQRNVIKGTKIIIHENRKRKKPKIKRLKRPQERKPLHDITGQTFGRLEVLRMEITSKSNGNEFMAICKCHACGRKNYEVKPSWVKKGSHSGTCGCDKTYFDRQRGENSVRYGGYRDINSMYFSNAKRRSVNLGLPFDLDMEFLWELYQIQNRACALSGVPLFFTKNRRDLEKGNISLDRIDSRKGYLRDNVQWVHKDINLMKMYLDESTFFDFCKRVCINKKLIT